MNAAIATTTAMSHGLNLGVHGSGGGAVVISGASVVSAISSGALLVEVDLGID
jgi:hypothetical protein